MLKFRWYRVEHQTLPVEFFLNFYRMLQDMNLKIGTDYPLFLSCDEISNFDKTAKILI